VKKRELNIEPFVSVLTPVYNGEEYLEECIQSVLNQSYSNWEYVIVNNYSTDRSLEIARKYAETDPRIRVHDNREFLDQMANLNHAFRQISLESEYCKVVHADDWLFTDCLTQMVKVAEEYPTVGIVSAYRLDGNKVDLDGLSYPSYFSSGRKIAREYLLHGTSYFGAPSNLLIRSDLIRKRDRVYDESYLRGDTGACFDLLKESDFGFVHKILTYTRRHDMSVTKRIADQSHAFIHGELKFQLDFGPYYLTEEEYKSRISNRVDLFYILLVRNLLQQRSRESFEQQVQIFESLGFKLRITKLLTKLIRELCLQSFKLFGFELHNIPREPSNTKCVDHEKKSIASPAMDKVLE